MELSWQQGPLSPGAIGRFLVPEPLPKRLLYAEPLRRCMCVRFGETCIADSEHVLLLFEPGRYLMAYFPETDVSPDALKPTEHMSGWAILSMPVSLRGSFILESGERPVMLLSAGIGATPVLAMLHALAAARSTRQVFWIHAARDRQHHPFAAEVRRLMLALQHGRSYVCYSEPGPRDKMGEDFDATGHLSRSVSTKPASRETPRSTCAGRLASWQT